MADSDDAGGATPRDEDVTLTFSIDDETMVALIEESVLMDDADIEQTMKRRLTSGLVSAHILGADQLRWRPLRSDAFPFNLSISSRTVAQLDHLSKLWRYDRDVLIATVLADEMCKPFEVAIREKARQRNLPKGEVRREPGKGNIYPVEFMMPGYQLVFIRMLGGANDKGLVLEEALVALARQIVVSGKALGAIVTEEAFDFARRMVAYSAPNPSVRRGAC